MIASIPTIEIPPSKEAIKQDPNQKTNQHLISALAGLSSVSLHEMSEVKLMNRFDSKFLVAASYLPELIRQLSKDYFVQEIEGKRLAKYKTVYLDTKDYRFFLDHVNGKLDHVKWRIRSYTESDLSFLEIKKKSNKGKTDKERIRCNEDTGRLNTREFSFIKLNSRISANDLLPVLQNNFNRITLVNKNKSERLTIDLNISFTNCLNEKSFMVSNLAIVELKQDRSVNSVVGEIMAINKIKKAGISKYCLGLVLTTEQIKGNRYKQKLRTIHKITSQK